MEGKSSYSLTDLLTSHTYFSLISDLDLERMLTRERQVHLWYVLRRTLPREKRFWNKIFSKGGTGSHAIILVHNHRHWFLSCQKTHFALYRHSHWLGFKLSLMYLFLRTLHFLIGQQRSRFFLVMAFQKSLPCYAILKHYKSFLCS